MCECCDHVVVAEVDVFARDVNECVGTCNSRECEEDEDAVAAEVQADVFVFEQVEEIVDEGEVDGVWLVGEDGCLRRSVENTLSGALITCWCLISVWVMWCSLLKGER